MAINLKLAVDKEKNKVAFAECKGDFVDVLFSFLTLPLGTIVRLLDKKSGLGFLDNLYRSVEDLETDCFQTVSCKSMLLQPRSCAENLCGNLAINIDDLIPRRLFRCSNLDCLIKTHCHFSSVAGVTCPCGQLMGNILYLTFETRGRNSAVFPNSTMRFIISDDLNVQVLSSFTSLFSILQHVGVADISKLEEITVQVDKSQVLHLLKRSLLSKTPLTDVFLSHPNNANTVETKTSVNNTNIKFEEQKLPTKMKMPNANNQKIIKLKILERKQSNKAILMNSKNDFVDLLFSFLTFPLGSALSLTLKDYSSLTKGCIHNLYNSVDVLKDSKEDIFSGPTKEMLLNPKLPPHFSCSDQILTVSEAQSQTCHLILKELKEINPKLTSISSKRGGGYARTSENFLITDELVVKPFSTESTIQQLKVLGMTSVDNLREREVIISQEEATNWLLACLTSVSNNG